MTQARKRKSAGMKRGAEKDGARHRLAAAYFPDKNHIFEFKDRLFFSLYDSGER